MLQGYRTGPKARPARWRPNLWSIAIACAAVACVVLVLANIIAPPALGTLNHVSETVTGPIHFTPGTRYRGPFATLQFSGGAASIEDICILWNCDTPTALPMLPPGVAALKPGDRVELWVEKSTHPSLSGLGAAWQIAHGDAVVLSYAQTAAAYRRSYFDFSFGYPILAGGIIVLFAWLIARLRAADSG